MPTSASGVAIVGSYAYLSFGQNLGLQVIDISSPASPATVGSMPGSFGGAAVAGTCVYVAGSASLQILPRQCEAITGVAEPRGDATPLSVQVLPNPSYHAAIVRFRTGRAGPARVDLFDVTGRLVRRLFEGPLEAGPHALEWDVHNGAGGTVPTGIYFVRISTAEGTGVARHVVLR